MPPKTKGPRKEPAAKKKEAEKPSEFKAAIQARMSEAHKKALAEFDAARKKSASKTKEEKTSTEKKGKRTRTPTKKPKAEEGCGVLHLGRGWSKQDETNYNKAAATKGKTQKKTKKDVMEDVFDGHLCPIFVSCQSFMEVADAVEVALGRKRTGRINMQGTQDGNNMINDLEDLYTRLTTSKVFKTMPEKFYATLAVFTEMSTDDYFIQDNEEWAKCGRIVKKWHDLLLKMLREHKTAELGISSDSVPRIIKFAHSKAKEWNMNAEEVGWAKNTRLEEM